MTHPGDPYILRQSLPNVTDIVKSPVDVSEFRNDKSLSWLSRSEAKRSEFIPPELFLVYAHLSINHLIILTINRYELALISG